ncbi:hypothetical protein Btru_009578 [Bulinus truncatus]|nr:hypothetical protein Btru_009578 [Bulinus truncatus]
MLPSNRGDDTIICPYDSSHVIQKKSFQNHLIKCRENNKNSSKSVCKFDKTHIVPTPELLHHLSECPSRSVFDRELQLKASSGQAFTGAIQAPEIINHIEDLNEDWGSAPPARTKALFNKKYDDSDEDEHKPYIPPGANYVKTSSPKQDHLTQFPQKKVQTEVKQESGIFDYSKNPVAKQGNLNENFIERSKGPLRGALQSQVNRNSSVARGISRCDGPQLSTFSDLTLQQKSQQSISPHGFTLQHNSQGPFQRPTAQNIGHCAGFPPSEALSLGIPPSVNTAPPGFSPVNTSFRESKDEDFREYQEQELNKLKERQMEDMALLDKRHKQELEDLNLKLNLHKELYFLKINQQFK